MIPSLCAFLVLFSFPRVLFSPASVFLTNDCGGGGVFLLLSFYHTLLTFTFIPYYCGVLLLLLVSAFLTFILAGLVFGFFLLYILLFGLGLGIGLIYMIIPFFLVILFLSVLYSTLLLTSPIHPSIKTTLYVPDTTCYDLRFDFFPFSLLFTVPRCHSGTVCTSSSLTVG